MTLCVLCVFAVVSPLLAQTVSSAMMLEQAGQLERAWDEYRQVLSKNGQERGAYDGFRRLSASIGRFDSLSSVSARLAQQFPNEVQFRLGRAEGLFGLKQRAQALAECRSIAQKWPALGVLVADLLQQYRENSEAIGFLVRERAERKDSLLYADRLAGLYEQEKRYPEAVREIVRMVNQQPDVLVGQLARIRDYARTVGPGPLSAELARIKDPWYRTRAEAEALLGAGKEREAVARAKKGLDKDGLYGFAHEAEEAGALQAALSLYQEQGLLPDQARVLRKLGRRADALAVLARDQSADAKFERAEILRLEDRDFGQAAGLYEQVLKARPGDEPAAFGLASCRLGLGQPAEARAALAGVGKITDRSTLLVARAWLYESQFDSCKQVVNALAARFPSSVLVNDGLELALLASGGEAEQELVRSMFELETGKAGSAIERAVRLAQGQGDVAEQATLFLAAAYRQQNEPKRAVETLDGFAARFPESLRRPKALFTKAEILAGDMKDENAYRRTLEELAVQYPGSAYAPVARSLLEQARRAEPGGIR